MTGDTGTVPQRPGLKADVSLEKAGEKAPGKVRFSHRKDLEGLSVTSLLHLSSEFVHRYLKSAI